MPDAGLRDRRRRLIRILSVNRSLGQKVIAEKLRESGVKAEIHDDHLPQDAALHSSVATLLYND